MEKLQRFIEAHRVRWYFILIIVGIVLGIIQGYLLGSTISKIISMSILYSFILVIVEFFAGGSGVAGAGKR